LWTSFHIKTVCLSRKKLLDDARVVDELSDDAKRDVIDEAA
jgi:hypothetical protein